MVFRADSEGKLVLKNIVFKKSGESVHMTSSILAPFSQERIDLWFSLIPDMFGFVKYFFFHFEHFYSISCC